MSFTDIFIRRPVLAITLNLLLLVWGVQAFLKLPSRQYPNISPNVIQVEANYPGASGQQMETLVTIPMENMLSGINGLDIISSKSSQGRSSIYLRFKLGYDFAKAMADVSNAIGSVRGQLPKGLLDPRISQQDISVNPILILSFSSKTMSGFALSHYVRQIIKPQLELLEGVSTATLFGNVNYAMRVWLDPLKMAAHQVTANDLVNSLRSNNTRTAPGMLWSGLQSISLTANTDINTVQQFNDLVIRHEKDYSLRIRDVGHAEFSAASDENPPANINGNKGAVAVAIFPLPTANSLNISDAVRRLLPLLQAQAPKDFQIQVILDISNFIRESLKDVKNTFLEACLCVCGVILLFLGYLRATLIPIVTIPLAIIGSCGVMLWLGYTLNTLSLLAWILATGLVVDDAIVVLENIHRHMELGKTPLEAALHGSREISFAVVSMTLTLAAVYAPIGFMDNITGLLFREFAFTLAMSVILSGLISLTLSPMMCAKLLKPESKASSFKQAIDHGLEWLTQQYQRGLERALGKRPQVLAIGLALYLLCFALYKTLASELAPEEDQGALITMAIGPTSANHSYMEKYITQLETIYKKIPEITSYILFSQDSLSNVLAYTMLQPWSQRHKDANHLIQELTREYQTITGLQTMAFNPHSMPGASGKTSLMFVLKTTANYQQLNNMAQTLLTILRRENPRIINPQLDLHLDLNQTQLLINREKANAFGVSMQTIGDSLNTLMGAPSVSVFDQEGWSYDVIPQLYPNARATAQQLNNIYVRNDSNTLIPLANLVTFQEGATAQSLNHFQKLRSVTLSASLAPGYTLGEAVTYLENLVKQHLPKAAVQYDFAGSTRQWLQTMNNVTQTLLFALLFIFLILAAQFESFRDPFIILLSVPLSLTGALLATHLTGGTLNLYTQIGLVTLVGLITKHGILIVEFANQIQRQQAKSLIGAVTLAASLRLRPILMTTAAMLLGVIPLVLAHGVGARARMQLGWVIFGGMSIGTLFTLFILPVVYTIVATPRHSQLDLKS